MAIMAAQMGQLQLPAPPAPSGGQQSGGEGGVEASAQVQPESQSQVVEVGQLNAPCSQLPAPCSLFAAPCSPCSPAAPSGGQQSGGEDGVEASAQVQPESQSQVVEVGLLPALLPTPCSLLPAPSSLLPAPCSLLPLCSSLLPAPSSLLPAPSLQLPAPPGPSGGQQSGGEGGVEASAQVQPESQSQIVEVCLLSAPCSLLPAPSSLLHAPPAPSGGQQSGGEGGVKASAQVQPESQSQVVEVGLLPAPCSLFSAPGPSWWQETHVQLFPIC